ncbi:hypothetical protein D9M68_938660 [compost metagenome]
MRCTLRANHSAPPISASDPAVNASRYPVCTTSPSGREASALNSSAGSAIWITNLPNTRMSALVNRFQRTLA